MSQARYNNDFFDYVSAGAIRSARRVLPLLDGVEIGSVLDVGCGRGAWLSVWQELGVRDVVGVDGAYVDEENLLISCEKFVAADLANSFDLKRRFDLAQCLEVAEHLPPTSAHALVGSLALHADMVLFSAATRGQGGENHINEQPYEYWRAIFQEFGYVPIDCLREPILHDPEIESWYRYNSFLYVRASEVDDLPRELAVGLVRSDEPLRDLSPLAYRIRKLIIRLLPVSVVSAISRARIAVLSRLKKI